MKNLSKTSPRLLALCLAVLFARSADAGTKYFDMNTTTAGSGVANNGSHTWTGSHWGSVDGTAAPGAWAANDDAVFCAGTDAGSKFFKVTGLADGSKFSNITVEEGYVQLEGGYATNTGTAGTGSTTLLTVASGCRLTETNAQGIYMAGTVGICKRGAGLYNAGGNQKYVGPTYIEDGTVVIVTDLATKLPFGLGAPRTANTTIHLSGGTLAAGAPGMTTVTTPTSPGTVWLTNHYILSLEGGALDMTPHTATFGAYLGSNWMCQAQLTGSGPLTKTGSGILTVTNYLTGGSANNYSGDTVINAGTLRLGTAAAIPSGAGKGNVSIASGAVLDLRGLSPTINGLTGSGVVTNSTGSGTYTLTVGANDQTSAFSGSIKGTGAGTIALAKTGTGTLTLNAANSYTGLTTINAGTLEGAASASIPGNVTVAASGVLKLSDASAMSSSANLTLVPSPGASMVNLNFTGTQTINALNFGATQKNQGTWGAVGSGAANQHTAFTGAGLLQVTTGNHAPVAPPTKTQHTAKNTTSSFDNGKLVAGATDADPGDTLTVIAASTTTPGATVVWSSTEVSYTPATGYTGPDSYTYTISDGNGGTTLGTVNVFVTSNNGEAPNVVVGPAFDTGSGTFRVTFAGIPGCSYTVETATSPTGPWTSIGTATAGADGLFTLVDTQLPPPPARYYRTVYP